MSRAFGGAALTPAQSQSTDILRKTLMKTIFFPKWSLVAFADWTVCAADSDILQRTAKPAHGMPFKMSQHYHRVVLQHVPADRHFLEVLPALDRNHHGTVLVHDVYRAEIPAVDLEGFAMIGSRKPLALIQSVGFHQAAIRNMLLQGFHHLPRKNIGTMRLTGVYFDSYLSADLLIDL